MSQDDYREILAKIETVRKTIGKNKYQISLPQITVIGDQSSGKSSLLSEISGVSFPNNSGITTKCPAVVYTKYDEKCQDPIYFIQKEGDSEETEVKGDQLSKMILEYQKEILQDQKVSSTPVIITAKGKNFNDLVLVDLPGIISNGEGKKEVIEMIERYIEPEESLILTVTEAKQDDETAQALELAKNFDRNEERTIRVLTKFDNFDSEDSESRAIRLVSNIETLSAHAVICRPDGKKYNSYSEEEILKGFKLPPERMGVYSLKERLPQLLCELIKTNLPGLINQIQAVLHENETKLAEIGKEAPDKTAILNNIRQKLMADLEHLQISFSGPMTDFREAIHQTRENINDKLVNDFYTHNAFECIFFQGKDTFNKILIKVNKDWLPIIETLFEKIEIILKNSVNIAEIGKISNPLRKSIKKSWDMLLQDVLQNCKEKMLIELEKEKEYKTMNHYLTSKYQENLILPEEIINKIISSINRDTIEKRVRDHRNFNHEYETRDLEEIQDNIEEIITRVVEENMEEFNREPIEEQHKRRILAASKANWAVSHKNLIDNILAVIKDYVLKPCKKWVEFSFFEDELIRQNIGEDPKIENLRKEYKDNIQKMKECLLSLK